MTALDTTPRRSNINAFALVGIMMIAACLRAPFTSMAPLLEQLKLVFELNALQAGLLITLPLICFAIVSPIAASIGRSLGLERTLLMALVLIAVGICVRSTGHVVMLYVGTAVVGSGIAVGNVLLPSFLKRDFPSKVGPLTATYVLAMGVTAAAASALAVPLSHLSGNDWRYVAAITVILPILASLAWFPQSGRRAEQVTTATRRKNGASVWRSPVAWQVTGFLGLDCLLYYVGVSWLPEILRDAGFSAEQAGTMHGVLLLATAIPGLVLIPLITRLKDQRGLACGLALSITSGLLGLLIAPGLAVIWILLFGFGAGGGLILALAFLSLRTRNASDAATLSGMAQCIGYLLAAAGPPLIGGLHEALGSWGLPLVLCIVASGFMALVGIAAGKNRQL